MPAPVAPTEKVTVLPGHATCDTGGAAIVVCDLIVSVAAPDVSAPHSPVTITS